MFVVVVVDGIAIGAGMYVLSQHLPVLAVVLLGLLGFLAHEVISSSDQTQKG